MPIDIDSEIRSPEVAAHYPASLDAPRRARDLVRSTLDGWGRRDLFDPCVLVVSELAANAVRHTDGGLTVALEREDDAIRIEVADTGRRLPVIVPRDRRALGGRGILIVTKLARSWGHRRLAGGGKVVWAVVAENHLGDR